MSIEPSEGDKLFYLAVAPAEAGKPARGMVMFALRVSYQGAGATLKEIQVAFPGSSLAEKKFARDLVFTGPKQTKTIWLEQLEAIELPAVAPSIILVRLIFEGLEPFERSWSLVRHKSPNPKGTGPLTLAIWDLTSAGITHTPIAIKATLGSPQVFELTVLSPSRLVTPLRADDGTLKVIVWDVVSDQVTGAVTLVRRGDAATAGALTLIAATKTSVDNQLATAVRKVSGECELAYWDIDDNGAISKTASTSTDAVSLVGICMFKRKTLATAVRTAAGNLQVDVWYLDPDSKKIIHKAAHDAGPIDRLALANVPSLSDTAATLVRTGGHLKLILWRLTGQNGFAILHGNELVGYYHMQKDSLNPALRVPGSEVKIGQLLGKAGNSGAADGPHLHISASRVDPALTPQDVMEQRASGQLVDVVRPLPFHGAKAMISANLKKGGAEKNPLSTLDNQGVYFDRYAILPDSKI